MRQKSQVTEAIVLKRTNVGEADRIVTLLTREYGKIACVAKGVREITSGRKASLEPGNHVKILLISTKSMSLLTQATLIDDCSSVRHSLPKLRQLLQVLEMVDHLCVEGETEQGLFDQGLEIRAMVVQSQPTPGTIRGKLPNVLPSIIVRATVGMGSTILVTATLGFLGLGAQPPTPEWGVMVANAREYLPDAWWFATFPGLAIFLAVLGFNLLGDGLRDALDPRFKI